MTAPQVNCFIGYATYMDVLMQYYAYILCLHCRSGADWQHVHQNAWRPPNSQNTLGVSTLSTIDLFIGLLLSNASH